MRRPPVPAAATARRCVALALAGSLIACSGEDASNTPDATEPLPGQTFEIRLDSERSDPGQFQFTEENGEVRIQTGPAGIAYHDTDVVERGDFRTSAVFVQYGAPVGYREAYGIFVGGRDLDTPDQEYTYLLVRGTGDFLVKRRVGETTETLVDWTPHGAIARVDTEGEMPENRLSVESVDGETRFVVNGEVLHTMPTPQARPYGIMGLRVNHRLDIQVAGWEVVTGADAPSS